MKKEKLEKEKGTKGITLVALVVTIVVLLILAGITISTLFGDNGIINSARRAAELTKNSANDTDKKLDDLTDTMNDVINGKIRVEPKNIEDWIYETDTTTNTITILKYKGKDTEVVVPNYIGGVKVKSIGSTVKQENGYNASECYNLWDYSICTSNTTSYGCPQNTITKVIISEGIEEIKPATFASTKKLKEIIIPNSVKILDDWLFCNCISLTNITIPNSVTSIEEAAFANCKSLVNITIPNSVTNIDVASFSGCTSLTTVNYEGTKAQWNAIEKESGNSSLTNAKIHCTDGDIN